MRAVFEDVAARLPSRTPWVAAQLATCEAEFSRLEATPDPDRWASAAAAWEALGIPYDAGYALMREGEATLARHGDRPRAARALNEAHRIASVLGALPLRRQTEALAARAGIVLEQADAQPAPDGGDAGVPSRSAAIPGQRGHARRVAGR